MKSWKLPLGIVLLFSVGFGIGLSGCGDDREILVTLVSERLEWILPTGGSVRSSPVVGTHGTIYVGSDDNYLYALNPDGSERWVFRAGGSIRSTPALDVQGNGTIYTGASDGNLYAIRADGTQKWAFPTGDRVESSPAVAQDRTVYAGSDVGYLYAVNLYGSHNWSFLTGGAV